MGNPKWTTFLCDKYDRLYRELPPPERFHVVPRWKLWSTERNRAAQRENDVIEKILAELGKAA